MEILFWLLLIAIITVLIVPSLLIFVPPDPPYRTIVAWLFGRTDWLVGGKGGIRFRIPGVFDYIPVKDGKRNLDIEPFSIVTRDNVFVTFTASIVYSPDFGWGDPEDDDYEPHRIGQFLDTAAEGGGKPKSWSVDNLNTISKQRTDALDDILKDLVMQRAKDWTSRHDYEYVKENGSEKIWEEVIGHIMGGAAPDPDKGTSDHKGLGIRGYNFTMEDIDISKEIADQLVAPLLAEAEREADQITADSKAQQVNRFLVVSMGMTEEEALAVSRSEKLEIVDRLLAEKQEEGANLHRLSSDRSSLEMLAQLLSGSGGDNGKEDKGEDD